jgi:hypothetical protein
MSLVNITIESPLNLLQIKHKILFIHHLICSTVFFLGIDSVDNRTFSQKSLDGVVLLMCVRHSDKFQYLHCT